MDWGKIKHFVKSEWGKDPDKAAPELVQAVSRIRGKVQAPAIIHVCWDDGGHAPHSYHYTGQAVDLHFEDQGQSYWHELVAILSGVAIRGIGFYPDWSPRPGWHLDIRDDLPRVFWTKVDEEYQYGEDKLIGEIELEMEMRMLRA